MSDEESNTTYIERIGEGIGKGLVKGIVSLLTACGLFAGSVAVSTHNAHKAVFDDGGSHWASNTTQIHVIQQQIDDLSNRVYTITGHQ